MNTDSLTPRKIEDVCLWICSGGTPSTKRAEFYSDGNIPWLKTKEIDFNLIEKTENFITESGLKSCSAKVLPVNTVIVAMYGETAGKVAVNKIPLCTNQACCNLVVNPKVADYRFVYFYLKSCYSNLLQIRTGGAQQNLNARQIRVYEFPQFSLNEQSRIADILWSIDSLELNLKKQNIFLESIAQTLFKSWFVNFDPVHAKVAGRELEGLSAEIAALFPSEFEESELGLIPRGWKCQQLKECCVKIANGATPKRNEPDFWTNGDIPWLKTGEFSDGFIFDSDEHITALGAQKSSVKLFPPDTILIALYGATVGKLAILGRESTFNQAATALTADDKFGQWLVYLWLKFRRDWIVGMASGGAQQNISKAIVEGTAVIRPSDDVLKVVNSILTPIFESMKLNSELARILSSLRDELLPRLISGKIRIEDAEGALADVMPPTEKQVA